MLIKTRMTEEEYADFTERLSHFDMSQAEFIRRGYHKGATMAAPHHHRFPGQ